MFFPQLTQWEEEGRRKGRMRICNVKYISSSIATMIVERRHTIGIIISKLLVSSVVNRTSCQIAYNHNLWIVPFSRILYDHNRQTVVVYLRNLRNHHGRQADFLYYTFYIIFSIYYIVLDTIQTKVFFELSLWGSSSHLCYLISWKLSILFFFVPFVISYIFDKLDIFESCHFRSKDAICVAFKSYVTLKRSKKVQRLS